MSNHSPPPILPDDRTRTGHVTKCLEPLRYMGLAFNIGGCWPFINILVSVYMLSLSASIKIIGFREHISETDGII